MKPLNLSECESGPMAPQRFLRSLLMGAFRRLRHAEYLAGAPRLGLNRVMTPERCSLEHMVLRALVFGLPGERELAVKTWLEASPAERSRAALRVREYTAQTLLDTYGEDNGDAARFYFRGIGVREVLPED